MIYIYHLYFQGLHTTDFTEMATLRRELASAKAEREVEVLSFVYLYMY